MKIIRISICWDLVVLDISGICTAGVAQRSWSRNVAPWSVQDVRDSIRSDVRQMIHSRAEVQIDPRNKKLDLDSLMYGRITNLNDDEMKKQEGDYIYRYRYDGGVASQVWLGAGRYETVDMTTRILEPIIVLQNHDRYNILVKGHNYSVDVDAIEAEFKKMVHQGQEVVVIGGTHALHRHEKLSIAVSKAMRGSFSSRDEEGWTISCSCKDVFGWCHSLGGDGTIC